MRPLARMWGDLCGVVVVARASDGGVWVHDEQGVSPWGRVDWHPVGKSWRIASMRIARRATDAGLVEYPRAVAREYAHPSG